MILPLETNCRLSEYYTDSRGIKLKCWGKDDKDFYILFDNKRQKIYKMNNDLSIKCDETELVSFQDVAKSVLRYQYLIQDDKTVFILYFCLIDSFGEDLFIFEDSESCYDDDRRNYEDQLKDYINTCRDIASSSSWPFEDAFHKRTSRGS